jgi:Acetyltransferases
MEQTVREYFACWLTKDDAVLPRFFAQDAVYYESYGPAYRGLTEITRWFEDWNRRGTVLRWDMETVLTQGDALVCKWYFECDWEGTVDGFDGVSWILFDWEGKITELREYQSSLPNTFPYREVGGSESLIFRRAGQNDFSQIILLYRDAVQKMREQGIDQWDSVYPDEATLAQDVASYSMYLLTRGKSVLSAVVLNEEQDTEYQNVFWCRHGRVAVLHRLCVGAAEQGNGVGRQTVLSAERELVRRGYDCIRLDAFPLNPSAVRLYELLGYEKAGEVTFRKGKFYCYEKQLDGLLK